MGLCYPWVKVGERELIKGNSLMLAYYLKEDQVKIEDDMFSY
jgi:hypothetical protein